MSNKLHKWLQNKYPQNYIIRNPYVGAIIVAIFSFIFALLYRPLNIHSAKALSYETTIALYCLTVTIPLVLFLKLLKKIHYFAEEDDWTFFKELTSIVIMLFAIGVSNYFVAFIIEEPADRWNLPTFLDSCKSASLMVIIPFVFFTIINYQYLLHPKQTNHNNTLLNGESSSMAIEQKISISSSLKKDDLSFYPNEFLYAESDGNYVIFHLYKNKKTDKKIIRNSISNIEKQLSDQPHILRTHRAFIVNAKKVTKKQGNTSGYRLTLQGADESIPVSRQNTKIFDEIWKQLTV